MLAERAAAMEAMRRGLLFMQNSSLVFALVRWRECPAGPAGDAALGRGLFHLLNRSLSKGFNGWRSAWEELSSKKAATRRS
eukprot:3904654-Prymnesium_polylepis.1